MKLTGIALAEDARKALISHGWPGNVRELDNAIQRALVLQQGNVIHEGDLCLELGITGRADFSSPGLHSVAPQINHQPSEPEPSQSVPMESAPEPLSEELHEAGSLGDDLRQQEFRIIIQTLRKERGRRNRAAEQLGISPRTLRYKLAQMRDAGIDLESELALA